MSYEVYCDGKLLYSTGSPANGNHTILAPVLSEEINTAGTFTFIVPPQNEQYNNIKLRLSTIVIKQNDKTIWKGRPNKVSIGITSNMTVTCEGSLAFLNDTIYPPDTSKLRLGKFLQKLLANHNENCDGNRQIDVGLFTMDDLEIEYNGADTSTMEVLRNLVETYGGYIVAHETDGGSYFDWLKSIPEDQTKKIDLSDVIDITKDIDASEVVTCVIPIGKDDLRIGPKYIENTAAVALFGRVWQAVTFNDIEDADSLYIAGENWLNENIWSCLKLDVTAGQIGDGFEVGKSYAARIESFGINHTLALTSREIPLDTPGTNYTFSASTIYTQINNGRDIADVMDSAKKLKRATTNALTTKTAKLESVAEVVDDGFTGKVEFSNGTYLNFRKGLLIDGKTSEGDF